MVKAAAALEPRHADLRAESVASVVSGMYGVVNEGGTGAAARIEGVEFSGKTGSAQRVSNDLRKSGVLDADEDKDNGWFVGFAPRENPEIVVAVLLEGGEHGALAGADRPRRGQILLRQEDSYLTNLAARAATGSAAITAALVRGSQSH